MLVLGRVCALLEREPTGVSLAKNRTNYLCYGMIVGISYFINMAICRAFGGGCDFEGCDREVEKLS